MGIRNWFYFIFMERRVLLPAKKMAYDDDDDDYSLIIPSWHWTLTEILS